MEVRGQRIIEEMRFRPVIAFRSVLHDGMECKRCTGVLRTDMLDDIYLAAVRPSSAVSHHPERRPCTLSSGELDTRSHLAVRKGLFAFGHDTGRGIVVVLVLLFTRLYLQTSVLHTDILRTGGVILLLVISPTTAAGVVAPCAFIQRSAVKLIGPYQLIFAPVMGYSNGGGDTLYGR